MRIMLERESWKQGSQRWEQKKKMSTALYFREIKSTVTSGKKKKKKTKKKENTHTQKEMKIELNLLLRHSNFPLAACFFLTNTLKLNKHRCCIQRCGSFPSCRVLVLIAFSFVGSSVSRLTWKVEYRWLAFQHIWHFYHGSCLWYIW